VEAVAGETRVRLFADTPAEGAPTGRQSPLRSSASRAIKVGVAAAESLSCYSGSCAFSQALSVQCRCALDLAQPQLQALCCGVLAWSFWQFSRRS